MPESVSVALVGSRKASATGLETVRALGLALAERGVCVVSGLALGVDAAAHEGAVETGGSTVGVLGCGIDVTYPTKYKRFRVALSRPSLRGQRREGGSDDVLAMAGSVVDALHPRHRSAEKPKWPSIVVGGAGRTRKRLIGNVRPLVASVGSDPT